MDPQATLQRMADAIAESDIEALGDAYDDYAEWRRKDGYEPPNGDLIADIVKSIINQSI